MCLAGIVVSYARGGWVSGSNPFNDKYFCHLIQQIQWKHLVKSQLNWENKLWFFLFLQEADRNVHGSNTFKFWPKEKKTLIWNFVTSKNLR